MEKILLASRSFTPDDQLRFAAFTGDFNPIHMDPLAARRTQAGAPIVHGVHSLLWLLDTVGVRHKTLAPVASLKVRFTKMVYLGDQAEAFLTVLTDLAFRAEVVVNGTQVLLLSGTFGPLQPGQPWQIENESKELFRPAKALNLLFEDMQNRSGYLAFATAPDAAEKMFPHASRWLGARRVAACGCSTFLVGMLVPGLHSIYGSLEIVICEDLDPAERLAFKVESVDARFRMVRQQIHGGGISGTIGCFARQPPVVQASLADIESQVSAREFAGSTVLIVGGSRGLGELTAKIIAAGGGRVVITYAVGQTDAESLSSEINLWGGNCRAIPFDARADASAQLAGLTEKPTHLYYFATPRIARRKSGPFDPDRLAEFIDFYVTGFDRLIQAALGARPEGITAFYPSSIFVEDRPLGMSEYAMAKAAGEVLCGEINAGLGKARIVVSRLPMLPTDQTAAIQQLAMADPLAVLLPLIREVQAVPS